MLFTGDALLMWITSGELKSRDEERCNHANTNHRADVIILISDKLDINIKSITSDKKVLGGKIFILPV